MHRAWAGRSSVVLGVWLAATMSAPAHAAQGGWSANDAAYDPKEVRGRDPFPPGWGDIRRSPLFSDWRQQLLYVADAQYNAELTIVEAPTTMQPGDRRVVKVLVKNTGSATWVLGRLRMNYALEVDQLTAAQVDWALEPALFTHDVVSGEEATILATITAPVTGKYALRFRLRGGPQADTYVGAASNEVVMTVGDPAAASLSCPSGYEIVDRNDETMIPDYPGGKARYLLDAGRISAGQVRRFCVLVDQVAIHGRVIIHVRDNTADEPAGSYSMRVVPPAGSGLQIIDTSTFDYVSTQARYEAGVNGVTAQPVTGYYLVTVTGKATSPQILYVGGFSEATHPAEIPRLGLISGKTVDENNNGIAAYTYISGYWKNTSDPAPTLLRIFDTFDTRAATGYTYTFPGLLGGGPLPLKISAYKSGYTSEYRVNGNPSWTAGSSVDVTLAAAGTPTVDWRFTPQLAVDAGADLRGRVGEDVRLQGTVRSTVAAAAEAVETTWQQAGGSGIVSFSPSASSLNPVARFSKADTYLLRLQATQGELEASDDVMITVLPPPLTIAISSPTDGSQMSGSSPRGTGGSQTQPTAQPAGGGGF